MVVAAHFAGAGKTSGLARPVQSSGMRPILELHLADGRHHRRTG